MQKATNKYLFNKTVLCKNCIHSYKDSMADPVIMRCRLFNNAFKSRTATLCRRNEDYCGLLGKHYESK